MTDGRPVEIMFSNVRAKLAAAGVLLALLILPAPLLPPHRLAEAMQFTLGNGWQAAYLVASVGLQIGFYGSLAALAVPENPLVRDADGLLKEELDVLTCGSGFSLGDLAADRAGARFAAAAARSEADAKAMQARLQIPFAVDDFFPQTADLSENLTTEQFRAAYGGVGSQCYRRIVGDIEARLDRCPALSARQPSS